MAGVSDPNRGLAHGQRRQSSIAIRTRCRRAGLPSDRRRQLRHVARVALRAFAQVGGVDDPSPPTLQWSFGAGASPRGTGQAVDFTYTTTGFKTRQTSTEYGHDDSLQLTVQLPWPR